MTFFRMIHTSNAEEKMQAVSLEEIAKFRESKDDASLSNQLKSLQKNNRPPADIAKLLMGVLIESDTYLTNIQCPKDTPSINIVPPGGSRSGADPRSIADPADRAAYEKLIAENNKLAEAHRKYAAVSRIKDSALNLLAIYQTNGLISETQVALVINKIVAPDVQKANLRQLVKTAVANKAQQDNR